MSSFLRKNLLIINGLEKTIEIRVGVSPEARPDSELELKATWTRMKKRNLGKYGTYEF